MSRRGFTLTEMLVVMGLTSVVMTVGVGMLHRVMHQKRLADRDVVMHRVAERLSIKLREDVHRADRAELVVADEGEQQLVLKLPDESVVTYIVRQCTIDRVSTSKSEPAHRDRFQFPGNYRLEFSDVQARQVSFTAVALPQAYAATANNDSTGENESEGAVTQIDVRRPVMRIEASVGRDHRFLGATKDSEVKS